jgi:hypothetical protein
MTCKPDVLRSVPLFALLGDDETAVLASHVANLTPPRHSFFLSGADILLR